MNLAQRIFIKPITLLLLGALFTIVISSLFYLLVNYKFYYKGKEWQISSETQIVKRSIEAYLDTSGDAGLIDTRKYIKKLIERDDSFIIVECFKNNERVWVEKNDKDKYLDGKRSVVHIENNISRNGLNYKILFKRGNRPQWDTHLYRAWTFSLEDYLKNKELYFVYKLQYRSLPLVFSVLLSGACVFSVLILIRKIIIDNIKLVDDLTSSNNKHKIEIEKISNQKKLWSQQFDYLQTEKDKLEGIIKNNEQSMQSLVSDIDNYKKEYNKLQNEMSDKKKIIENLKNKLKALNNSKKNLENVTSSNEINALESDILYITKENSTLNKKKIELENLIESENIKYAKLKSDSLKHLKEIDVVKIQLSSAMNQIETLTCENNNLIASNKELIAKLNKITKKEVRNAEITYFQAGCLYSVNDIQSKLKFNEIFNNKKINYLKYSDRYFYPQHALTFSEMFNGEWIIDGTSVYITVPIDPYKENTLEKKSNLEQEINKTKIAKKTNKILVDVKSVDKKEFLHMRKLEVVAMDGTKVDYIFDVGMDFVKRDYQSGKFKAKQDNYVVIQDV